MLPAHVVKAFAEMMNERAEHLEGIDPELLLLIFCEGYIAGSEWRLAECRRTLSSHIRASHGAQN